MQHTIEPTPENQGLLGIITGPILPDWSNAIMLAHPVTREGNEISAHVPDRNDEGRIREDADGHLVGVPVTFTIPAGHPWHDVEHQAQGRDDG